MPTYNIQISAHAQNPGGDTFKSPAGYTYKFFCDAGEVLGWDLSVSIYQILNKGHFAQQVWVKSDNPN